MFKLVVIAWPSLVASVVVTRSATQRVDLELRRQAASRNGGGLVIIQSVASVHNEGTRNVAEPFATALAAIRRDDGSTCVTTNGRYMGRLSNTVSMVNEVLKLALSSDVPFVFPQFMTSWMKKTSFDDMFGEAPVCKEHETRTYQALCSHPVKKEADRCATRDLLVDRSASNVINTTVCNCTTMVAVNASHILWQHDYRPTWKILNDLYWRQRAKEEPSLQADARQKGPAKRKRSYSLAAHVRLGDIEENCEERFSKYNCMKRGNPDAVKKTLKALFEVVPASCFNFTIYTDGLAKSHVIATIVKSMRDTKLAGLHIHEGDPRDHTNSFQGDNTTGDAFAAMAASDVLIYGASGFGRLAAVLGRPGSVRIGYPVTKNMFEGMDYLPDTTQVSTSNKHGMIKELRENRGLMKLAAACAS